MLKLPWQIGIIGTHLLGQDFWPNIDHLAGCKVAYGCRYTPVDMLTRLTRVAAPDEATCNGRLQPLALALITSLNTFVN